MRQLFDTHNHLVDAVFDRDRADVIAKARNAGVSAMISVTETLDDARKLLDLVKIHPEILPACGLYPTVLDLDMAQAMVDLVRSNRETLVAIGEVGLDYWKIQDEEQRAMQREIFSRFIDLALELDLPLNVHSRSTGRHVIGMLLERGAVKVQLHAFDGKPSTAMPALEAGYFFSIPPSIARSRQKQKLVRHLPLTSLLLETDSPVLAPEPGMRNEPCNLPVALHAIAEIKGLPAETIAEMIAENVERLYGSQLGTSP